MENSVSSSAAHVLSAALKKRWVQRLPSPLHLGVRWSNLRPAGAWVRDPRIRGRPRVRDGALAGRISRRDVSRAGA